MNPIRKGLVVAVIVFFIVFNNQIPASTELKEFLISTSNDGSLSGYVYNISMRPVLGARVRVYFHGTFRENYTDTSGYYEVTDIPICNCTKNCTASKPGYTSEWVMLSINETTNYDFVLTPLDDISCNPGINGTLGDNDWFVSNIFIDFTGNCHQVFYKINNFDWIEYNFEPFYIQDDGEYKFWWFYIDHEENQSEIYLTEFKIDQTPPDIQDVKWETFREGWGNWYCKFICNSIDNTSSMDRVEMYINDGLWQTSDGPGPVYEFVIQWGNQPWGNPIFNFLHYDLAGNSASDSVNASDIKSYPKIIEQNLEYFSYNSRFIKFPLLQMLLEVLIR